MPGRAQPVGRDRIAELPQGLFRGAGRRRHADHLGAEDLAAEAGVLVGLLAAQAVVHVQRLDVVAERLEHVPEAGRVGTAGDERENVATGRDQLPAANLLLDPGPQCCGIDASVLVWRVHDDSVAAGSGCHGFGTIPSPTRAHFPNMLAAGRFYGCRGAASTSAAGPMVRSCR